MRRDHRNTTCRREAIASRSLMGRLRKSLERTAAGGGRLRAALGDSLVGLGLIATLMDVFLGVYLATLGRGDRAVAASPATAPLTRRVPTNVESLPPGAGSAREGDLADGAPFQGTLVAATPPA